MFVGVLAVQSWCSTRRPDLEAPEVAFTLADLHFRNHGARWSAPRPFNDRLDGARIALDHRLHAAVAAVAHPAGDAELARFTLHVEAKAHALHAAGDGKMPGDGIHAAADSTFVRVGGGISFA